MDEEGRRSRGRHRFERRRSGRSGTGHFSDTRSCARLDAAGDRWTAHARPGIKPVPRRRWRRTGKARMLDACDKKNAASCPGVSAEVIVSNNVEIELNYFQFFTLFFLRG